MELYEKTVRFVDESFKGKQKPHFERTVFWFERWSPVRSEAHKIAAYAHDIERAMRDESKQVPENYLDPVFLRDHQEKGAAIMAEFLEKNGAGKEVVDTVSRLIRKHEEGGDAEQNALRDADSASFFETNADMFVNEKAPKEGYEKIKKKFDWMFERMTDAPSKETVRPLYEKWVGELGRGIGR